MSEELAIESCLGSMILHTALNTRGPMDLESLRFRAVLMIYIEPTPYILALIRSITNCTNAPIEVLFIGANISQPWNLSLEDIPASYLPHGTMAACREIARRLSSAKYSVVHLAGWGHPVLTSAMILARLYCIPLAVETDTVLPITQSWIKRVAKRLIYPTLLTMPAVFLPGGSRQKRYLRHYGVPETRIVIAQMTVDVTAIINAMKAIAPDTRQTQRQKLGQSDDDCVFLFVGRLDPVKGVAALLQAFSHICGRNSKSRLLIVGDGTLRGMVETAVAKSERIRWVGRLTGNALISIYAVADVFVLPSIEQWGLAVNEAMAAGLPVIVSEHVGCIDDLVIDGKTGIVIETNKRLALSDAMMRLAGDVRLRREMGAAARQRISTWTIEAEAEIVVGGWHRALHA